MIPFRDAVPARTRPVMTLVLIATSAAVVILFRLMPSGLPDGGLLSNAEGARRSSAAADWLWAGLSLVRPVDWLQGVSSAAAIWIFGPTVEDRLGHGRYVILYLGCATAAAAAVALASPMAFASVGLLAGGIGGVIGAHASLYPRARTLVLIPVSRGFDVDTVPAALLAGFWVIAQMASSAVADGTWPAWVPRLALVQMAVGLLVGGGASFLLRRPERMRVEWWNR